MGNIYYKNIAHIGNTSEWEIFTREDPNKIGAVEFYIDNKGVWINKMNLDEYFRGKGIIAKFINTKKIEFGSLYVSIADKAAHKKYSLQNDSRYIEQPDDTKCVENLFNRKILDITHFKNPFNNDEIVFGKSKFPFLKWD